MAIDSYSVNGDAEPLGEGLGAFAIARGDGHHPGAQIGRMLIATSVDSRCPTTSNQSDTDLVTHFLVTSTSVSSWLSLKSEHGGRRLSKP